MHLNSLAIFVAAIISFVLGMLWYSPALFAKAWVKEMGWSEKDTKNASSGMTRAFAIYGIGNLIMAYVLANIIELTRSWSVGTGAVMGFWCWLGFLGASGLSAIAFERRSWKLFAINQGYGVVSLLVMGAILGGWR